MQAHRHGVSARLLSALPRLLPVLPLLGLVHVPVAQDSRAEPRGREPGAESSARPVPLRGIADATPRCAGRFRARVGASTARRRIGYASKRNRSEEHTSELQSQFHLVCRLLLEKKKKKTET